MGSHHSFLFYVGGVCSTPALDLKLWPAEQTFAFHLRPEVMKMRPYPVDELASLYQEAAGYCRRYNCNKAVRL